MRRTIFVCNALEDNTRLDRGISSDSPAASKKIFEMAYALRSAGEAVVILSMGRGSTSRGGSYFSAKAVRINGISIVYAPFSQIPVMSQLLSLISMPYLLYVINRGSRSNVAIFYNRTSAYIPTLFMCVQLGIKRILDLEDGELRSSRNWSISHLYQKSKRFIYDKLCSGGTILACSALEDAGRVPSGLCYYGAIEKFGSVGSRISNARYKFLLGGTVSIDTGADLLVSAIQFLRMNPEVWMDSVEFIITGKGDCIDQFKELSKTEVPPFVRVTGRLTDIDYGNMIQSCDVGLALKPNNGLLANTTFPSKVVELASAGLLVITTDISDVKMVMGSGALYLDKDDVPSLIECFHWVISNPEVVKSIASAGILAVKEQCSMETAGLNLADYIFEGDNVQ